MAYIFFGSIVDPFLNNGFSLGFLHFSGNVDKEMISYTIVWWKMMENDKYGAHFRNLPVSPSIPATLVGFKLSNNFKIIPSYTQMNSFSILDFYNMPRLNLYCIYVLD